MPKHPELAAKVLDLAAGDPDLDVKVPLHYYIYGTTLFFLGQTPPNPRLIPCWNKKFSVFFLKKCFFSKKFVYIHHQSFDWNTAILMKKR